MKVEMIAEQAAIQPPFSLPAEKTTEKKAIIIRSCKC